jgi:hypothetical protein
MDIETLVGWAIMLASMLFFLWRMRAQLTYLQYGKRRAALFVAIPFVKIRVTLYGVGSMLYSLVETAGITAICFFALHVGYVIMSPWYRLENIKYGLIGIAVTAVVVDVAAFAFCWFRIGHSGAREFIATAWVSLMTGLLVLGAAAIVVSEGKLLDLLIPLQPAKFFAGIIILAFAFVATLLAVQVQVRSARLI